MGKNIHDTIVYHKTVYYDTIHYIIGTDELGFLFAGIFFIIFGATLSVMQKVFQTGLKNPQTPNKFDLNYLVRDKFAPYIFGIILGLMCMRFTFDWFSKPIALGLSFFYGYFYYMLANLLSKVWTLISELLLNKLKPTDNKSNDQQNG